MAAATTAERFVGGSPAPVCRTAYLEGETQGVAALGGIR